MGIPFAIGQQMLLDGQLNYTRGGQQCFLRVQNFAASGDFQEVGVPVTPTGVDAASTGFTDILIQPPPDVRNVSMHNIGLSGGKLQFGARIFFISASFVDALLCKYPSITDPYNVWRNWDAVIGPDGNITSQSASVIGLVYENRLFSIEDIKNSSVAGKVIRWTLTCNWNEQELSDAASEVLVL